MPRLPSVNDLSRPAPAVSRSVTQYRGGRTEEAGVRLGSAVAELGFTVGAMQGELAKARRGAQLSDALSKSTEELNALELSFQNDQDFRSAPERFKKQATEINKRYLQSIDDSLVRETFNQKYLELAGTKELNVLKHSATQERDYNVASLDTAMEIFATAAATAQNAAEKQAVFSQAALAVQSMRASGWITDVDAGNRGRKFLEKVDLAQVLSDIQTAPGETATKLGSADYAPSLDPVLRERLTDQASRRADQVANAQRIEAERERVEGERLLKQKQDARQNELLVVWNAGKLDTTTVVNDPTLTFPQKHVLLGMVEQRNQSVEMKTDDKVFLGLLDRIHLPDSNPNKIRDENQFLPFVKARGGINYEDLQRLRKEFRDKRDPDFGPFAKKLQDLYKVAESDLTKTNSLAGIKDPKGDQLLYEWKWEVDRRVSAWKDAGKDQFELLDPTGPNYLGKLIGKYRRSPMQITTDTANEIRSQGRPPEPPTPQPAPRNVPQPEAPKVLAPVAPQAPAPAKPISPTPPKPGALPPEAVRRLKEGINTRFENGQVWRLENGKPKQVK